MYIFFGYLEQGNIRSIFVSPFNFDPCDRTFIMYWVNPIALSDLFV